MTVTIKKQRSPSYPFIPLRRALERAWDFYVPQRHHAAPLSAALELWGYGAKSSGGLQTVSALKQFALMEDDGSGDDRHVKLTELALRILRDERDPSPERVSAIREAAMAPKIHAFMRDTWGSKLPPKATVKYKLVHEMQFNDAAADELIKEYEDTISFAGLGDSDKINAETAAATSEPAPDEPRAVPPAQARKVRPMEGERELITGLLSKDASFRLIVSGKVGEKEIERLIKKLELDKEILGAPDEDSDDPEPTGDSAQGYRGGRPPG